MLLLLECAQKKHVNFSYTRPSSLLAVAHFTFTGVQKLTGQKVNFFNLVQKALKKNKEV